LTPSTPEAKVENSGLTATTPLSMKGDRGSPQISAVHAIDLENAQATPRAPAGSVSHAPSEAELPVPAPGPSSLLSSAQGRVEIKVEPKPVPTSDAARVPASPQIVHSPAGPAEQARAGQAVQTSERSVPESNQGRIEIKAEPRPVPTSDAARVPASPQIVHSPAGPAEQVRAGQTVQAGARSVPESNRDATPAPGKTAQAVPTREAASETTPALRSMATTIPGREIASEPASDRQSTAAEITANNVTPENNTKSTYEDRLEAAPVRTPIPERVLPPKPQQQRPTQESDSGDTAPKAIRSQAGEKRDVTAANRNEGQGNPGTLGSQLQPAQGPRSLDTRMEGSAADPPHTTKVATEPEINTVAQPQPARQISLKLTGADSAKVAVELTERAGKVLVAVRTSDRELAKSLETDLGDLVGRLESKGFKTEAWAPAAARHTPAAAAEQSNSATSHGDPRQAGSGSGQRQGRQGQNGSNQRQQARWMEHVEETLSAQETRMEKQ
jgi:hypothetical protein